MAKKDRSNKYYEARLKKDFPTIHADLIAGKYPSVRQAAIAAGLIKEKSQLHALKNAWKRANTVEKREFISWIRASSVTPAAGHGFKTIVDADRRLFPAAKAKIEKIMNDRNIKSGQIMREIGHAPSAPALGLALHSRKQTRLQDDDFIKDLTKWVNKH